MIAQNGIKALQKAFCIAAQENIAIFHIINDSYDHSMQMLRHDAGGGQENVFSFEVS